MSEAAHVPFTETKAPESAERLHRGALGLVDISASTMANIGPAYSFYFGFAGIVITAGLASPLVMLVATVAIALLGNTLSQFSRAQPSTGGFITFIGKTFGGTSAVTTALVAGAGYIIAISSVLVISGGFLSIMIQYYTGSIPWIIFSALFTAGAMFMMFRGVAVSTKLAGFFFAFELVVLLVVSIAVLIKNGGHLSSVPFQPSHLTNHFSGLGLAFPLAVYLFIGWENSAALAEETNNPRRNVPRAVFLSITLMALTYLLVSYATVTGFHYNAAALTAPLIPFISVAHSVAAWLAFIAYLAGLTSTLGVLIAAVNSQCRLIFNAGREGLLPRWLGHVHPVRRTPVNAIIAFVAIASAITLGWALGHWIGGHGNSLDALNFFFESSTMGTILILFVYFTANVALPFYYRKYRPAEFSPVKHVVLPFLGMVAIAVPIYYLFNPPHTPALLLVPVGRPWVSSRCPSSTRSGWSGATPAWAAGSARSSPTNSLRPDDVSASATGFVPLHGEICHDRNRRPRGPDVPRALRPPARPGHRGRVPGGPGHHGGRRAAGRTGQVRLLRPRGAAQGRGSGQPGNADRRLRAFLVNPGTGESTDAVVSLTHTRVVSARPLDPVRDGQMPILESASRPWTRSSRLTRTGARPWPAAATTT